MLTQLGWKLEQADCWTNPEGTTFQIDTEEVAIKKPLAQIAASAAARLWQVAVAGYCGKGLELGICERESFLWLRRIRAQMGGFGRAMLLENWLAAAAWIEQRCFAEGLATEPLCKLCGLAAQTMTHLLYECVAAKALDNPDIQRTNSLCDDACRMMERFRNLNVGMLKC